MELTEHIAAVRAGEGDPAAMVGEFRRTAVLVPLIEGGLCTAEQGGVRWIQAFTDEEQLAAYARVRESGPYGSGAETAQEWEYAAVLGARLLDVFLPRMPEPAGVAIDVADEDGAMLLPPVAGVVPGRAAVDGEETGTGDDGAGGEGEGGASGAASRGGH